MTDKIVIPGSEDCYYRREKHDNRIMKEEREIVLDLFEVCLEQEGFLVLDHDEPVILVSDVKRLITALRGAQ